MTHLETVLAFIESWRRRDVDHILAQLTEDCLYHNMPWAPLNGHAEIAAALAGFVGEAEEIDWVVHRVAETAEGHVLTERLDRFLIRGRWVEMPVMGTFELRDGRIAAWRDYFDSVRFQTEMAAATGG